MFPAKNPINNNDRYVVDPSPQEPYHVFRREKNVFGFFFQNTQQKFSPPPSRYFEDIVGKHLKCTTCIHTPG